MVYLGVCFVRCCMDYPGSVFPVADSAGGYQLADFVDGYLPADSAGGYQE